ncbi:MAG: S-layer homology domain-containing protein [Clostridia bacterium]
MKKNHVIKSILAASLAGTMLFGSALAAPVTSVPIPSEAPIKIDSPIRVYGSATEMTKFKDSTCITLKNSNDKDPYQEIGVLVSNETIILDAVTGDAKTLSDIKLNETLYAYVSPAMTKSIPPQSNAVLVLCNIPADFAVPSYAQVKTVTEKGDNAIDVLMSNDVVLHLNKDTKLMPYLTKNNVTTADITPGVNMLSWYSIVAGSMPAQATPSKAMVFKSTPDRGKTVTRQEFIDMLYSSAKKPTADKNAPFSDSGESAALNWAYSNKIVLGAANSLFLPNQLLDREQLMLFTMRYATALGKGPTGAWATRITYNDASNISDWATAGAMWNQITGIVKADTNNNILPHANATQSEAAAAIDELLAR